MIFSKDRALNSAEAALVTRHIISHSRNVPASDFDRMTPDSPRISRIGFCNESEAILGNFVTKSSPLAFILGFDRGRSLPALLIAPTPPSFRLLEENGNGRLNRSGPSDPPGTMKTLEPGIRLSVTAGAKAVIASLWTT